VGIANAPSTWIVNGLKDPPADRIGDGKIRRNVTYYSNPLGDNVTPSATVVDSECRFSLTNTSNIHTDVSVNFPDFTSGDAMTNSNLGSNGANTFGAYAWYSGMTYSGKVVAKDTGSDILVSDLGETTNIKWGLEVKTQTLAWTTVTPMTSEVVISAEEH
jgi:hypothetical protein